MLAAPEPSRWTRFKNAMKAYSLAQVNIIRNFVKSFTRRKIFAYALAALFTLGIVSTYPISAMAMFTLSIAAPLCIEILFRSTIFLVKTAFSALRNRARNRYSRDEVVETPRPRTNVEMITDALRLNDSPRAIELLTNENVAQMTSANLTQLCEEAIFQNRPAVFERLLEHALVQAHLSDNENALLILAVQERRQDMVTALLRNNQVKDNAHCQNNVALREACSNGSLAIVQALIACPNVLQNITFNQNEVVRLAQNNGHYDIILRLLQIDAVANFQNNGPLSFTPRPIRRAREFDMLAEIFRILMRGGQGGQFAWMPPPGANATLRELTNNRESAMGSLSQDEIRELGEIQRRHQHTFDTKGIDAIFAEIRTFLEKNYEQNPIVHNGKKLPLKYDPSLSANVQNLYRASPEHTAYRYLFLHPNPWIAPDAPHTNRHPGGGRSAAITREQKTMIAYLWLDATDLTKPAPYGYTHDQLKMFFANVILGGMGRGHNYDDDALNRQAGKEVDDGKGDKPTCTMGVKKWIAQFLTIICDKPSTRPLTTETFVNRFKAIYLAEGGHKEAIFSKLTALNKDKLIATQAAMKKLYVDRDDLEPIENQLIKHLEFSKTVSDAMMDDFKAYFDAKRITTKQRIAYQGTRCDSYEALLQHLSKHVLEDFYAEIDAKITSILKPPAEKESVGKVLKFSKPAEKKPAKESEAPLKGEQKIANKR
jgi:hypothetical protein